MMIWLHAIVVVAATVTVFSYVCRLDLLRATEHRAAVVLLHVALAGVACQGGLHAAAAGTDLQDVLGVIAAASWIAASAATWRAGVPEHVVTRPAPLARDAWADL